MMKIKITSKSGNWSSVSIVYGSGTMLDPAGKNEFHDGGMSL